MKKIIVYFPFTIKEKDNSGSTVRPKQILKSFRMYGEMHSLEIIEIHGNTNERNKKLEKLYTKINPDNILFCYMENATLPCWFTDKDHLPRKPLTERKLLRYLYKNKIKIGLFYRDVYWMFDAEYPLKGVKKVLMKYFYKRELKMYKKYIDYFFLPSLEMNGYLNFPNEVTSCLPPGGTNLLDLSSKDKTSSINLIYVGGISKRYGLSNLLKATSLAYELGIKINLNLVCRKEEYEENKDIFQLYEVPWLNVYHVSGEQLKKIYRNSNVAIIPIQKNKYNDFAVPVKLFEYVSYGLPIIATNCNAQAKIINENNLGIVVRDDVNSLLDGIRYFSDMRNRINHSKSSRQALINNHLWLHRIEQIFNTLSFDFKK